ncbi:MAG: hypothetical protein JRI72_00110 [Deltaproteobacteria bacterium]|nr:hypothetical protein [Deltaproteobacteria bacterium]
MAFRLLNGALQGKYCPYIPSNASSDYLPVSSDAGKLVMASSNTVHAMSSTTISFLSTDGSVVLAGIFVKPEYELDESSCSTFGSTSCKLWVQPILPGDILEVDYTTATYTSGSSGDLHTTNIGMFYRPGFSSDSTNVTQQAVGRSYLNVSTGTNVSDWSTGNVFRLNSYSTVHKTAEVVYDPGVITS